MQPQVFDISDDPDGVTDAFESGSSSPSFSGAPATSSHTSRQEGEIIDTEGLEASSQSAQRPMTEEFPPGWSLVPSLNSLLEDPRHDFGPALKSQCVACGTFCLNRGCKASGQVFCLDCYGKRDTADWLEATDAVPDRCIQIVVDASQIEARAMASDRASNLSGISRADAIACYRTSADMLSEAAQMCPAEHPDAAALISHVREILVRSSYLESLGELPAEVPLEEHIHSVQLTMGSQAPSGASGQTRNGVRTSISAATIAGVAGLLVLGPISGVAMAAGASYVTTREDRAGRAARGIGDIGIKVASRAVDHVEVAHQAASVQVKAVDERLRISENARAADEKLHVSETVQAAAGAVSSKAQAMVGGLNERYQLNEKLNQGLATTATAVSGLVSRMRRGSSYAQASSSSDTTR